MGGYSIAGDTLTLALEDSDATREMWGDHLLQPESPEGAKITGVGWRIVRGQTAGRRSRNRRVARASLQKRQTGSF